MHITVELIFLASCSLALFLVIAQTYLQSSKKIITSHEPPCAIIVHMYSCGHGTSSHYRGRLALNGVTLCIFQGEKTTLLLCIFKVIVVISLKSGHLSMLLVPAYTPSGWKQGPYSRVIRHGLNSCPTPRMLCIPTQMPHSREGVQLTLCPIWQERTCPEHSNNTHTWCTHYGPVCAGI